MNYLAQSNLWQLDQAFNTRRMEQTDQSRVLAKFKQIFPLVMFPDEIIIEELRIIWVHRDAPWADEVISIMATDIASIDASAGPFFGRVLIKNLTGGPEIFVDNLFRSDVYKIRCLVEGITLTARAGLRVEDDDLNSKIKHLASAGSVPLS